MLSANCTRPPILRLGSCLFLLRRSTRRLRPSSLRMARSLRLRSLHLVSVLSLHRRYRRRSGRPLHLVQMPHECVALFRRLRDGGVGVGGVERSQLPVNISSSVSGMSSPASTAEDAATANEALPPPSPHLAAPLCWASSS